MSFQPLIRSLDPSDGPHAIDPVIPRIAQFQRGMRGMHHGCAHCAPQEESGEARTRTPEAGGVLSARMVL